MSRMRILYLLVAAALLAGPLTAQELEAFTLGDFVSPGLLEPLEEGGPLLGYFHLRGEAGYLWNYQTRYAFTDVDQAFFRLSANLYSGGWQLGFSALALKPPPVRTLGGYQPDGPEPSLEQHRLTFKVARYFASTYGRSGEEGKARSKPKIYNRLTLAFETSEEELTLGTSRGVKSLHVCWDARYHGILTGLNYSFLDVDDGADENGHGGRGRHYTSLTSRGEIHRINNRTPLELGFGIGAENTQGQTKMTAVRGELTLVFPLKLASTELRLGWASAWRPDNRDHDSRWNHEVSLLIGQDLVSKLISW